MKTANTVGHSGTFVTLGALRAYLGEQYGRHMNGRAIAAHKFFGRRFKNGTSGTAAFQWGSTTLVPVDEIGPYLEEQYAGMGGGDIANHRYFLRNVPTVTISP